MSEREDEMARAINERAQKIVGGSENNNFSNNGGKSYADFKKAQKNKMLSENPQDFADTSEQQNPAMVQQTPNQQNYQPQGQEKQVMTFAAYGGFWRRLAASFLDYWPSWIVTIFVVGYMVSASSSVMFKELELKDTMQFVVPFGILFIAGLVNTIYNAYLYFTKGQTIGYRLLGMKVISEKTGQMQNTWPLVGRWALKTVITIIPYLGMIGMLVIGGMIAWSDKKNGPHDMAAGTLVVMEKVKRTWLVWFANIFPFVFIAAMGILAGTLSVFIDPSTQIEKANEAMLKSTLAGYRTSAVLSFAENNSYENVCNNLNLGSEYSCSSTKEEWVVKHKESGFCVDITGKPIGKNCIDMDAENMNQKNIENTEEIFEG